MEKVCSYETMFIVKPNRAEEEIKALVDKFVAIINENGSVESVDELGKRRLAYSIADFSEGYYFLVTFKGAPTLPLEIKRVAGINDAVLRMIVIKLDEKQKKKAEPKKEETPAVTEAAE